MVDHRDQILQLIRLRGPLLPSEINKDLGTNTLFASAMLSELVDKKIIKLSSVKVGGSPLYYYPGQENKLQQYSDKLHEKEQRTYEILREKKILKDKEQDPITRVTLRSIKDFAIPIEVSHNGERLLFWKWYLLSSQETEDVIRGMLGAIEQPKPEEKQQVIEQKQEIVPERKVEPPKQEVEKPIQTPRPMSQPKQEVLPQPKPEIKPEPKPEPKHQPVVQKIKQKIQEKLRPIQEKAEQKREEAIKKEIEEKEEPEEFVDKGYPVGDKLFAKVNRYFEQNNIQIEGFKVVRKNSDIEFFVNIPSNVGVLRYFCKAKDKKKINEGDLSSLYLQGSKTKLPILLLITGELTKKLENDLGEDFKGITIKRV